HLRAWTRPDRPGTEYGLMRRVLVEVDEYPLSALFLPPGGRDEVGPTAFQLTRDGDGGAAHLIRVPTWLEADVHVQATVAGRLWAAHHGKLVEQQFQLACRLPDVAEVHTRAGIEVDPQFVGVVRIASKVGPDVETQAAQIHRPEHMVEI